ncbi:glutathione peroxidase [Meredithblackwellia eburnea MCA 4105]
MSSATSFFDLKADLPGSKGQYDFNDLKGKVTLIVNVASKCGFTPQYKGLQSLYDEYHPKGLEILGFPSNQFGGQEPGSDEEIASFCELNHGVSFPLMKKGDVNGDNQSPVYSYLKSQKAGMLGLTRIKWNFEKFLINQEGEVVQRYSSLTKPETIAADIERLLSGGKLSLPASPAVGSEGSSE